MTSTMLFCLADLAKALKINNQTWRICLALAGLSAPGRRIEVSALPASPGGGMCLLASYYTRIFTRRNRASQLGAFCCRSLFGRRWFVLPFLPHDLHCPPPAIRPVLG